MNSYQQPGFPITEELPAVVARPPRRWFGAVVVLFAVTLAVLFGILIYLALDGRAGQTATSVTPEPEPTTNDLSGVIDLEDEPAGLWRVVGVEGGLNVRDAPGTSTAIIGAFPADERNIRGTGERAEVNGSPWTQVDLGGGVQGWVSSLYLAVDDGSAEPTPTALPPSGTLTSTVCFQSSGNATFRTIRLNYFDRTDIRGQIRTDQNNQIQFETVTGELKNGRAKVTILADDSEDTRKQTWRFDAAVLHLTDDEAVRVVSCDAVTGFFP